MYIKNPLARTDLLSPQFLLDCDVNSHPALNDVHNNQCDGGIAQAAFNFLLDHSHVFESQYPYTGKSSPVCQPVANPPAFFTIGELGYDDVRDDVQGMEKSVRQGPTVGLVSSSNDAFRHYHSGIIDNTDCNDNVDHAVLIIGFGQEKWCAILAY